jgi:putative hydrolase
VSPPGPAEAAAALRRIAFLLERTRQPTYRVRAFRTAAGVVEAVPAAELAALARCAELTRLRGVGDATAGVVAAVLAGEEPAYLARLEAEAGDDAPPAADAPPVTAAGRALRAALRGDLHTHSDWSDGGSPIEEMARAARDLGHEYAALTDHSPRLTVARGLSPERLREQLRVVAEVNERVAPFRLLTGIEVDILLDGSLDQEEELLARLDVVVASVHSKLRMPRAEMTRRMVTAVRNPHVDVLGHCTGRLVTGRGRPESEFDPEAVFGACAESGVAVEVNSRPERLDPPRRLLRQALDAGCLVAVDTDAHAPGQLDWQAYGATRAAECGVDPARVVNAHPIEELLAWTGRHTG